MKLELKHLAIAFANKYKVTYFDDERELNQVCNIVELREDECTISNGEYEYDVKFDDIKLLCFPLSTLTKEITINGKNFMPIKVLQNLGYGINIMNEDFNEWFNEFIKSDFTRYEYSFVKKLIEWKFDVYGLIEAGLAELVTEKFNPYK